MFVKTNKHMKNLILPKGFAKIIASELNVSTDLVYKVRSEKRNNIDVQIRLIALSQEEQRKQNFVNKYKY